MGNILKFYVFKNQSVILKTIAFILFYLAHETITSHLDLKGITKVSQLKLLTKCQLWYDSDSTLDRKQEISATAKYSLPDENGLDTGYVVRN